MEGKVYKITNKSNNKVYIGCTTNTLLYRFNEHKYRCFKTDIKTKLCNSLRKYGADEFEIELIEECEISDMYEIEKKYIELLETFENGLNCTIGGEGCSGYTHSDEIRKKISEIIKNGKSHKGKTYETIYGEQSKLQKNNRKKSVKHYWDNLNEKEKEKRINKLKIAVRQKSKFSEELIKEIKDKIKEGCTNKKLKEMYPQIKYASFFSNLRNERRWKNV